jgi:serine/threonine protein kinase
VTRRFEELWGEIGPSLDAALALEPAERQAWVDALETSQPAVAAKVRSILLELGDLEEKGFLDVPAASMLTPVAREGQRFGAYTLDRTIGQGGMGTVWLAHRSDGRFEGEVAIKLLNASLLGRDGEERFRREGHLLARLEHPNISRLLDAGVSETGQPFLVLEYVRGQPINRYCDHRRLDVRARIELFLDVLAAISHAHSRLVIHRDLKPANIFVTDAGALKLLDFGIAKLIHTEQEGHEELTRLGSSPRTLTYASPEQITGTDIGTASDIYSLGVLLYELVTGVLPYCPKRDTLGALEEEILSREPVAPSRVSFTDAQASERHTTTRKLGRSLRGDLDTIILTALKKGQSERYATAAAFTEDLKRHLRNEPILARGESSWYRLRKFVSRNRVAVAMTALVITAILGSVAFAFTQMLEARAQRDEALFEARRANATSSFMSLMLSEVGPGGKPLPMRELLDKGLAMLEKQYGEDPRFIVQMLIQLSGRYMDIGEPEKELEVLVRAESLAKTFGDPELNARVQCNTVETELSLGRPDRARERMQQAERELAKLTHPAPVSLQRDCLNERAYLAKQDGDYESAIDAMRKSLLTFERDGQTKGTDYENAMSFLSSLYDESGNAKEAFAWNVRTEQVIIADGRGGTLARIIVLQNRAMSLLRAGQVRQAEDVQMDVLRSLTSDAADKEIPPPSRIDHGRILARLGRSDEALRVLESGLQEARQRHLDSWESTAHLTLGSVQLALGHLEEASRQFDAVETYLRLKEPRNLRWLYTLRQNRARLAAASGRADEARLQMTRLLQDLGYPASDRSPYLGPAVLTAASLELSFGAAEQAEALARDAVRLAEQAQIDTDQSADLGEALLVLARARLERHDTEGAHGPLERAIRCLTNGLGPDHPLTKLAILESHGLDRSTRQRIVSE